MGISLDRALGVHVHALSVRVERAHLLASNLANIDTPGYLARDYDFKSALEDTERRLRLGQSASDQAGTGGELRPLYRVPMQPSRDGNTAELGTEQAAFAANAMDFQTSLTFLNMKFAGLRSAIEGQ